MKWEELCQPKAHGGSGLRTAADQNKAFLSKLAYQLVARDDYLWVQVLRGKYGWSRDNMGAFKTIKASHTWRSIASIWEDTSMHISWHPGSGKDTKFWSDSWVDDTGPLKHLAFADISDSQLQATISEFLTADGQWNLSLFEHLLPAHILLKILAITAPTENGGPEQCYWSPSVTGEFSVSSAYSAICEMN